MLEINAHSELGCVKHLWPEQAGFRLVRKNGMNAYTFWHFLNSVSITTPNGKVIAVNSDACYVSPPNIYQSFISEEPLIHDWFHFDSNTASDWLEAGLEFNRVYYVTPGNFVSDYVQKVEAEFTAKNICYEKMINALLCEMFIKISRKQDKSLPNSNEYVEPFKKLRLKIFKNLNEEWTVERMASEVNLSVSHFHAIYKNIYGISPIQDVINARVSSASEILENTNIPIAEISAMLGYSSPYHFTHQFSKITDQSPAQYRKTRK